MNKVFSSDKLYISKSSIPHSGRGVFAKKDIKKGEVVETSSFIEIPTDDPSIVNGGILITYYFFFGKNKDRAALALGFGSMFNHSYTPNIAFKIKQKEKVIEFKAIKNIKKDIEITFNYHGGSTKKKRFALWFEA